MDVTPQPATELLRVGVLGLGSIGRRHALMAAREVPGLRLVAVCDRDKATAERVAADTGAARAYDDAGALLADPDLQAVVIATPHSRHICFAAPALEHGLHVLVEKPVAMSIDGAIRVNRSFAAARGRDPKVVFAAMFQQRLMPVWRRLRDVVREELGPIRRVGWTVTDWFRTEAYYASGGWRGTWEHEGGGVLMNQAPHNLDLLLWLTGVVPRRVTAVTRYGRYHNVEVEDEVAAVVTCDPAAGEREGPVVTFATSTGEAPGSNRLEIVGDRGSVVAEDGRLRVRLLEQPASAHNRTGPADLRHTPYLERVETPGGEASVGSPTYTDQAPFRRGIFEDFARCVRSGAQPVAPGVEGLASLELANAMLLSGDRGETVTLPLDPAAYLAWLRDKTLASKRATSPPPAV